MDFNEILKEKNNEYEVSLGYNNEKEVFKINVKEMSSIVITGSTGTSKSILMHEILLQLVNKISYKHLKIVPIALTRVELVPYADTNYSFCEVINDKESVSNILDRMNNIVFARKRLFLKKEIKNFGEYNKLNSDSPLDFIVIAIDEATNILEDKECTEKLFNVIDNCKDLGILVLLNTNNVYNSFFEDNLNLNVDCKISFDFVSSEDSALNNIDDSHRLLDKNFIVKFKDKTRQNEYFPIEFNDKYINEVLSK